MKYRDLTLNQKISLKGEFETNKSLHIYRVITVVWNFVKAVDFFLTDDYTILN